MSSKDDEEEEGVHEIELSNSTVLSINGFGSGVKSTGGEIWEAAYVALRYVETLKDLSGKNVCDVSSGTGLVGIGAAALGAKVTLTDFGDELLALMRDNCRRNMDVMEDGGSCVVKEMKWGDDVSELKKGFFDYVILSDLLYCAFRDGLEKALISTIEDLVGPHTTAILAFKVRVPRKEKTFLSDLAERKLNIEEVDRSELDFSDLQPEGMFASMFAHEEDMDIHLYLVTKK